MKYSNEDGNHLRKRTELIKKRLKELEFDEGIKDFDENRYQLICAYRDELRRRGEL